jgi:Fe2+ or Zn2+ uptake regulation protein
MTVYCKRNNVALCFLHMHQLSSRRFVNQLQQAGFRMTKLRLALIDLFTRQTHPISLEAIQASLGAVDVAVHRVTLYRELEFLESQKLIVAISLPDGKPRYEYAAQEHHHHLVCTNCHDIDEIILDDDFNHFETMIAGKHQFAVQRHSLEFFGLCANCQ